MAVAGVKDFIHEETTGTGTGNLTLSALSGRVRFSDATDGFGTGGANVFDYFISNRGAAEWERGTGSMSDANTLVRDTVIASSNADAAVSFSAGTKDVMCAIPSTENYFVGGTDVAVVDGGTGSSTAAGGFSNLKQDASLTASGVTEYATAAEFRANSTNVRAMEINEYWDAHPEVTLTDAANISWDMGTGINFVVTLGGNRVLDNATNLKVGSMGYLQVIQDVTGNRLLTYGDEYVGNAAPTLSTGGDEEDLLEYRVINGAKVLLRLIVNKMVGF